MKIFQQLIMLLFKKVGDKIKMSLLVMKRFFQCDLTNEKLEKIVMDFFAFLSIKAI